MKSKVIDLPLGDPYKIFELLGKLNKKQFTLKDIGVSARVHNNWRGAGIIPNAEADGKWASYDFYQYLWLRIVKDLRTFGLPLEAIVHIKDILFKDIQNEAFEIDDEVDDNYESLLPNYIENKIGIKLEGDLFSEENIAGGKAFAQNLFKIYVFNHLFYRSNTTLYVYLDGFVDVWNDLKEQLYPEARPDTDEPHITLPLAHYFMEFLSDENKSEFLNTVPILSNEEKEVLQAMRNKELKEFTVKFIEEGKNRRIDIITKADGDISENQAQQITRILGLKNYENITIKKNNGSKLYFEREKRQKL